MLLRDGVARLQHAETVAAVGALGRGETDRDLLVRELIDGDELLDVARVDRLVLLDRRGLLFHTFDC